MDNNQDEGGEPTIASPRRRRRPVRLLSAGLFLLLAAGGTGIAVSARRVVKDQEHRLLEQRAAEVAALLNLSGARLQEALHTASTVVAITHDDGDAFATTAQSAVASRLVGSLAVLQEDNGGYRIVHSEGPNLAAARTLGEPVLAALRRAGNDGVFVSTPVFEQDGQRRLGYALLVPGLAPRTVVYGESVLAQATVSPNRQNQLFGDLTGAVYHGTRADPTQLVLATSPKFRVGSGAIQTPFKLGADTWLAELTPVHPLVSTLAARQPWLYFIGGLLAAFLVAALVEVLLRRRQFAMALVEERTGQLRLSLADLDAAQQQLVQQERLAAIGQLASAVGHELRNPLGVLTNVFYLLRSRMGDDEWIGRQLATGEREVGAATLIVSDLLEFSRPRQPVVDRVDVAAIVEEVLTVAPPPSGVEVARRLPADLPPMRADRSQLRQVLLNLVSNAYDSMSEGGLLVVEADQQAGSVHLTVSDTGTGIPDEVRPRLFEPFFTTKAKGIGLGLSVAHRIVEAHGGTLEATSHGERGASFTVALPVAAVPATPVP